MMESKSSMAVRDRKTKVSSSLSGSMDRILHYKITYLYLIIVYRLIAL